MKIGQMLGRFLEVESHTLLKSLDHASCFVFGAIFQFSKLVQNFNSQFSNSHFYINSDVILSDVKLKESVK